MSAIEELKANEIFKNYLMRSNIKPIHLIAESIPEEYK